MAANASSPASLALMSVIPRSAYRRTVRSDELPVLSHGLELTAFGARKRPADQALVHLHGVVGQPRDQLENRGEQEAAAAEGRQAPKVIERDPLGFAEQPRQVVVRDTPGALRVDAEGSQPAEPFDQVQEVPGARRAGRSAEPGDAAEPTLRLDLE